MHTVTTTDDVALSAEAAWAVIGDFSGIRKWATLVEAESTRDTPDGKIRTLTMPGGRTIDERLTAEGPFSYTYTLERPDMNIYLSTVSVEPAGPSAAKIVLVVEFDPKDEMRSEEFTEGFSKFHRGNLKAMKRALGVI